MQNDSLQRDAQRVIASFPTYEEAQEAVDRLADERFPVERLVIVGCDLAVVEQVTGRLSYPRVAAAAATSGAILGALLGLVFSLFVPAAGISVLSVVLYWLVAGALAGAVVGVISYASTRGRRDFASSSSIRADRYDVLADEEVAEAATRSLYGSSQVDADTASRR